MSAAQVDKITPGNQRSTCPIASVLDVIGDKWSMLVLRDMVFIGKNQFNEFLESNEGISTNVLADRLKRLESNGIISRQPYQENPVRFRYSLTDRGLDLRPLLFELIRWGNEHIEGTYRPTPTDFTNAKSADRG